MAQAEEPPDRILEQALALHQPGDLEGARVPRLCERRAASSALRERQFRINSMHLWRGPFCAGLLVFTLAQARPVESAQEAFARAVTLQGAGDFQGAIRE